MPRTKVKPGVVTINDPKLKSMQHTLTAVELTIEKCKSLVDLPSRLHLRNLIIQDCPKIVALPVDLQCQELLSLADCPLLASLPASLKVRKIVIRDCPNVQKLPSDFECNELIAPNSRLTELPSSLRVGYRLDLSGSRRLTYLPTDLYVGSLVLRDCTTLEAVPEGLRVTYLDLEGCSQLNRWPSDIEIGCGHLNLRGTGFSELPAGLTRLARLDLRDCSRFTELPEGLTILSWIDVGGTNIRRLPDSMKSAQLRWRGVTVSERIVFQPETLTKEDILGERNAEVRRVMLERVGFDRFFEQADAELLDQDRDPGGERKLLRVILPGDEALVCVTLSCPSTGRRYVLRVPPKTASCREAAAWLAGYEDVSAYQPLIET